MSESPEVEELHSDLVELSKSEAQLVAFEEESKSLVFDVSTKKGRTEARGYAYKIRRTKTAVKELAKEAKAEILARGRKIDAMRNEFIERLDAVQAHILSPVEEEEQRLKDLKAAQDKAAKEALEICDLTELVSATSKAMTEAYKAVGLLKERAGNTDFGDNRTAVFVAMGSAWEKLPEMIEAKQAQEEQAEELARLQKAENERLEREAQEKAERATKELEEKKAAQKAAEAAALAQKLAQEAEAKLQAEKEALQRQRDEAEQRAQEAEARAEAARQEAVEAERQRVADEKAAKEAAEAARIKQEQEEAEEAERKRLAEAKAAETLAKRTDEAVTELRHTLKELGATEKLIQAILKNQIKNLTFTIPQE